MQRTRSHFSRIAAILILTALAACDNVQWGGTDLQIVPPPPPHGAVSVQPDARAFAELGMPAGNVLFHVRRDGDANRLVPIAEIQGTSIRQLRRPAGVSPEAYEQAFRETVLPVGGQFTLFRRGARVGTFAVQAVGAVTACGVPTSTGTVTTVAAAADVGEFIAFRQGLAPEVRGEFSAPAVTGTIRTYASILAERLILQQGLPRPRSWAGAQRNLQAIEIMPGAHPEMAATYLVGDSLGIGPADPQGYSVFYIADFETRRGYTPIYSDVRNYSQTGKAAPALVDHLNIDGQGGEDILMRVFGTNQDWYQIISQDGAGRWTRRWEGEAC